MDRRVVVTGIGILSPLALSTSLHWDALVAGESGIAPVAAFDTSDFPVPFAAELKGFKANKFVKNRKSIKIMARDIQLAVAAASLAASDGGIYDGVDVPERLGVSMGAGLIPSQIDELGAAIMASLDDSGEVDLKKYGSEGLSNLFPLWLLKYLPNMLNSHISIEYEALGPNNCITVGNASGLLAIGEAARVIERGQADMMLAGAAESKVHLLALARLRTIGKLSTSADLAERGPRPFAAGRDGLVIGEAGVVVLLEEARHAAARGAKVYANVAGFGSSCGNNFLEELDEAALGARYAMKAALADAGLDGASIDAVFADASGLPEDSAEAEAIAEVIRGGAVVTATRAACGHTMAASGALDFANACLAVSNGVIPGTFGADGSEVGGIEVIGKAREADLGACLVNAFTFGGQTASMVVTKPPAPQADLKS